MFAYIIIGGAAVGQTLFLIMYTFQPWWSYKVGRALYLDKLTMAILIDVVFVRALFPDAVSRAVVLPLYGVVMISIWYQLFTLISVKRKARKNEVSTLP